MNGNQTAVLAFNYLIEARKTKGIAQPNDMVITTIVTTPMIDAIAKGNNLACYRVLTGFKWIGDKIRDKDGISAVALLCEMAAYEKEKGRSLFEKMVDLYVQYGYYKENLISITKKGMDGQAQIAAMMEAYRNNPPKTINGSPVVQLLDYELSKGTNPQNGDSWVIDLPKSNVLQFILEDGSIISARPSGTEPKIKFYFSVNGKLNSAADFDQVNAAMDEKIKAVIADMKL
jgi:phosphoglucomutase